MLTHLHFKNWRSLKDVEIELTPITVFIGANASGKTNIVDGLRFFRERLIVGLVQAVLEIGYTRIQTDALHNNHAVEIEITYKIDDISSKPIRQLLALKFDKRNVPFEFKRVLWEGNDILQDEPFTELPLRDVFEVSTYSTTEEAVARKRTLEINHLITPMIQRRWQILSDNFSPRLRLSQAEGGDPYVIDKAAHNTLRILDFMASAYPTIYENLQSDVRWMLQQIDEIKLQEEVETRTLELRIRETARVAPTISSGTARLISMLSAIYALDLPQDYPNDLENKGLSPDLPGLVVIEEPNTALNPGLLRNFVELIRGYVEDKNRQFIFTTHNPAFLNYFKPEEVRVVERDENGYTTVKPIPEHIKEIWLDKYGLGEVWMTHSLGGLPE